MNIYYIDDKVNYLIILESEELVMENRCITKVKSQVDIENIIYPYNNNTEDVFIDLGHYDNDNNVRVSDIIIKFN